MTAAPPGLSTVVKPGDPVISLEGFGFRHVAADRPALADVSLDVRAGEYVGVLGATGAGVSTLLTALDGVVPQLVRGEAAGRIAVLGRDPRLVPVREMARDVGIVFDDPALASSQATVAEEVAFGLENLGVRRDEMDVRITAALEAVGLAGFELRAPTSLSGGELQRLAIACALVTEPAMLVLDEPSANLDPAGRRALYDIVRRLNRERGVTVVASDQDVEGIAADATRAIVIGAGRVMADGTPAAVLGAPATLRGNGVGSTGAAELANAIGAAAPAPTAVEAVARLLTLVDDPGAAGHQAAWRDARPPDGAPVVELRGVSFSYPGAGRPALADVSLAVSPGEVVGIVGANGSGKTTLGRLVNGLLRAQRGRVMIDGLDTAEHPVRQLAAHVASVFQDPAHQLFASTVAEELALGPRALGVSEAATAERVRALAKELSLDALLGRHPLRLGRAERKLVALGAVLAMRPRVLVLDEPTTGHDTRMAAIAEARVKAAAGEGTAVLIASHDMAFLGRVAGRLVVMDAGRVLADAPTRRVFADAALLAAAGLEAPGVTRVALAVAETAGSRGPRAGRAEASLLWPPVTLEEAVRWLLPAGAALHSSAAGADAADAPAGHSAGSRP